MKPMPWGDLCKFNPFVSTFRSQLLLPPTLPRQTMGIWLFSVPELGGDNCAVIVGFEIILFGGGVGVANSYKHVFGRVGRV